MTRRSPYPRPEKKRIFGFFLLALVQDISDILTRAREGGGGSRKENGSQTGKDPGAASIMVKFPNKWDFAGKTIIQGGFCNVK